ncbi:MAG: lipid-binding SYLF domain-containing protein [Gammaproteobacteria bacterium]|nr:lipid-binding SYLF domain-containing protein [Gammaproteobacteria bacterium]
MMNRKYSIKDWALGFLGLLGLALATPSAVAQNAAEGEDDAVTLEEFDPGTLVQQGVAMLEAQMGSSPDKRVPQKLLQTAKCVAIFPEITQVGLGVGGKYGRGMVSCRRQDGSYGVPLFARLTSLTIGLQAGVQQVSLLMLIMSDKGLETLLTGKPMVGAQAGVAAGPVGREAGVDLDIFLQSPIVTYSRSKGLFAGAVLEGAAITRARRVNKELYGDFETTGELLFNRKEAPEGVRAIQQALDKYAAS